MVKNQNYAVCAWAARFAPWPCSKNAILGLKIEVCTVCFEGNTVCAHGLRIPTRFAQTAQAIWASGAVCLQPRSVSHNSSVSRPIHDPSFDLCSPCYYLELSFRLQPLILAKTASFWGPNLASCVGWLCWSLRKNERLCSVCHNFVVSDPIRDPSFAS